MSYTNYHYFRSSKPQYAAAASSSSGFVPAEGELASQIRQQIEILKGRVSETGVELDRCRQEQEAFSMEYYSFREMAQKCESMQQQVMNHSFHFLLPSTAHD